MYIDRFMLANADDERDFFVSGGTTMGSFSPDKSILPFGVFPRLGLSKMELSDVTLFCGGSNTAKTLLLRLIALKLGVGESLFDKPRYFDDYCRLSTFRYVDFNIKSFPCEIITKSQNNTYTSKRYESLEKDDIWSVVQLYENIIEQPALYLLEEPDSGMSLPEQIELACIIHDAVKYYGAQFIITTNSPVLLGIKRSLIYDFDSTPILPCTWSSSTYSKAFAEFCCDLKEEHNRKKIRTK